MRSISGCLGFVAHSRYRGRPRSTGGFILSPDLWRGAGGGLRRDHERAGVYRGQCDGDGCDAVLADGLCFLRKTPADAFCSCHLCKIKREELVTRQLLPFRRLYLVMNALLMGSLVTQAGLIGFVGLLVPHGCRMVMGADHRKLLPVSVLSGGLMTVWADILGRILIHGVDIPLGVSLSLIGAPVFLRSYHFGGEGA